ncbi:MAG: von Willebrand factor type A domain-containing protein [Planctomycetes bacterium]|nr:von Willebrand factor type A domain-containing protein [Planctomycetota bacterium]
MTNHQEQHEQLCAYVLGEGTSEERAAIERELLRSPELRAQKDTLERTIGLVKTALAKDESLSPQAAETVYSAAASSKPGAWQSVPWMRLAAGLGAVALGAVIVREVTRPVAYESTQVAQAPWDFGKRVPADTEPRNSGETLKSARQDQPGTNFPNNPNVAEVPKKAGDDKFAGGLLSMNEPQTEVRLRDSIDAGEKGNTRNKTEVVLVESTQQYDVSFDRAVGQEQAKEDASRGYVDTSTVAGGGAPARPAEAGRLATTTAVPESKSAPLAARKRLEQSSQSGVLVRPSGGVQPSPTAPASPATPGASGGGNYKGPGSAAPAVDSRGGVQSLGYSGSTGAATGAPGENRRGAFKDDAVALKLGKEKRALGLGADFEHAEELDRDESVSWYELSPVDQQAYLDMRCRRILEDCRPRPNEKPRDMFFRFWGDNPFEVTALDSLSTFAADVDTASYTLARRYIEEGNVPEKAQIRTEEFVNYFKSDAPAPTNGVFGIHTNLTASRFSTDTTRQMLRVVVRGKDLSKVERPRMNLTFVVDVSGSMREQNRLEMVKHAMRLLTTQLDPYDKIGIVKFSTDASVVLPLTNISDRAAIESAIQPLKPEGSTNSNAGLELGYAIALGGLDLEATNRVVFLSDGVANVGEKDPAKIAERVKPMREKGIYLNTIGVGMNNHNDVLLEQLADKADGMCTYIDSPAEAKKQLVDNFSGAFQPIARDVKIQVEFDPQQVLRYRLLGYENRAIADADFRNDKVDAGELGAGHQVTALYELERQGPASSEKPLATVRVRWKEPRNFGLNAESDKASEIEHAVSGNQVSTFEGAGQSYRKAVLAAQFAEILRRSIHARGDSLDDLLNESLKLQKEIPGDTEFSEFVLLVSKSKDLILRSVPACDELCQAIDAVREHHYRRAQLERLQAEMDQKTIADLKRQNDELEAKLRDLVRRRLENKPR